MIKLLIKYFMIKMIYDKDDYHKTSKSYSAKHENVSM